MISLFYRAYASSNSSRHEHAAYMLACLLTVDLQVFIDLVA